MMNSRDLTQSLITNKGPYDRVGLYEHFWNETLRNWLDQGYPSRTMVISGQERVIPEDPALHFDFDMRACGGLFDIDPIQGYDQILEETDEWAVRRNGAGADLKWWKHKSGTPEHMGFLMSNCEVWERDYRPHLLELDRRRFETGRWKGGGTLAEDRQKLASCREANKWSLYAHVFLWEAMRQDMGDVTMYESLVLDPAWIHDFNQVYTDFYKKHFRALFEELGLPDGIWIYEDLGYKVGLTASPKVLADLVFPYYAELVDFFHGYGLPVVLHTCGNITAALPLIVDAGFDGLNPMEVKAGCDTLAFAERYGGKLAFIGGFDVRVLETNDREAIAREVIRMVEGMKARGARYFFHTDHSVSALVQYDSYRYALDVYREHMCY